MTKFIDFWTILYIIEAKMGLFCPPERRGGGGSIFDKGFAFEFIRPPIALAASAPSADRSPSGRNELGNVVP